MNTYFIVEIRDKSTNSLIDTLGPYGDQETAYRLISQNDIIYFTKTFYNLWNKKIKITICEATYTYRKWEIIRELLTLS